ncbi:MAG: energy-coupling factor ABC transporter ATP-binding protein [Oscillospiraceae bacterium]|jgi:cobalt/nickel transport system ATP-binding protein|nr:energy-coupling factor ABC transporter ATP-binding protein [Oscillospiraceae bacterium]
MLEVREITVIYPGGAKAVDGVSFRVNDGASVALAGSNGAGKTTLLLALVGLLPLKAGSVRANDVELSRFTLAQIRRTIGLVFQNPDDSLFMPRVLDDVMFGPVNLGLSEPQARERAMETLVSLGVERLAERSPLRLSGGEKRMAGLAAVLAMRPSILLLDEPTAFLDPKSRRRLADALIRLPQTKLIATHDLSFAAAICNDAILLKNGALLANGACSALFSDAALMESCDLE